MPELITIYKPGKNRTHSINVLESRELRTGEDVSKLTAEVQLRDQTRPIRLVRKIPRLFFNRYTSDAQEVQQGAQQYFEIWERLKRTGIPVVDNLWIEDERSVVMTDLSTKGTLFDKETFYPRLMSELTDSDKQIFIQTPIEEIREEAAKVLFMAGRNRIVLSMDDPLSMLIYPNRQFKIYALDIGLTQFNQDYAFEKNRQNLWLFLDYMSRLKREIY